MIRAHDRPLLRRRESILSAIQPGVDAIVLTSVGWLLIRSQIGFLTPEYAAMLLLLLGILAVVFDQYDVYRKNVSFTGKILVLVKAWTLSFCILTFIGFASKQGENFSRLLVAQLFVSGLFTHTAFHLLFYKIQKTLLVHHAEHDHALILGEGNVADYLALKLDNNPWLGQKLVGIVSVEDTQKNNGTDSGLPCLGGIGELDDVIEQHQVKTVYIVTPLEKSRILEDVYFSLLDKYIAVHWIPDIFSLRLVNHSISEIAGIPMLTLSETPLTGLRLLSKSVEDKLLAALILLVLSPFFLIIGLMIKLDSPGPVFFRQQRAGWGGKIFRIWKFRSMYVHEPQDNKIVQAKRNDSRVTRVGAFLRRTSLDEIPQLLNVLTGDMSLVGPRPHAIQHDEEYSKRISDYFARHQIKPGITGLAQVRGFRGETPDIGSMVQRVESDIEYINNWSIWLDMTILMRTVTAFYGKNAY